MLHVVIIQDTGILQKYLRKIPVSGNKKRYLCLEEESSDNGVLLEKEGFLEITPPQFNDDFKKEFLLEYVNLVGSIGLEFNSRRWWGTDIASKNRFTSVLPYLLHQFNCIPKTSLTCFGNFCQIFLTEFLIFTLCHSF